MPFQRIVVVSTLIFCLVFAPYSSVFALPPNLLTNPGAETGDFTGWTNDVDDPWMVDNSDPRSGLNEFVGGVGSSSLTRDVDMLTLGYTQAQLDTFTNISLTAWVKQFVFGVSFDDQYGMLIALQGEGHGTMAFTYVSLATVPADWTQIEASLGNYGPGLRYVHIELWSVDGESDGPDQGAMFDDLSLTLTGDSTEPTLESTTPADNGTPINVLSNLSMTFNETVYAGTGNVVIHRASDGATVQTIDIQSDAVSGFGSSTITINPPSSLLRGNPYYITVDDGAVLDGWSNAYAGISSTTGWNIQTTSSSKSLETLPPPDYSFKNVTATITPSGEATIAWTAASSVPFVRVFVSTDANTWQRLSEPLTPMSSFSWQMPSSYQNVPVTFRVEATDLAQSLSSTESNSVVWETASTTQTATQTIPVGNFVRTASQDTVYYINGDGARQPIPNAQTFFTWERSFDVVHIIDAAVMATIPLGRPLPPKPGTVLVKITSIPKVYSIDGTAEHPVLHWIPTESLAALLFGDAWATNVLDIPPTSWSSFTVGADRSS